MSIEQRLRRFVRKITIFHLTNLHFTILTEALMELGFLVDVTSDSFTADFFPNVLRSIKMIYSAFIVNQDKTRVGVVTYNGSPSTAIALNQYNTIDDVNAAVDGIKQSTVKGPGSLGQGITYTTNSFFKGNTRIQTPKILVIITSSKSRDDVGNPATEAKKFNTTIFVIGVGSSVDKAELNSVASPVAVDHVIFADYSSKDSAAENGAFRIKKGRACMCDENRIGIYLYTLYLYMKV